MGIRREKTKEYDAATRWMVIRRDGGRCLSCGNGAHDVHEIVSRSAFGTKELEVCFNVKNRCCLCRNCHNEAQGDIDRATDLLNTLRDRYGYEYNEPVFVRMTNLVIGDTG